MKLDRLKEEIGWLKVYFLAFFAVDISLIAWVAQNFHKAETVVLVGAWVAIIIVTAILALSNRRVYKLLEKLERL